MSNNDLPPLPDDIASLLGQERVGAFDPGTAARGEVWSKLSHSLHLAPTLRPPDARALHGRTCTLSSMARR